MTPAEEIAAASRYYWSDEFVGPRLTHSISRLLDQIDSSGLALMWAPKGRQLGDAAVGCTPRPTAKSAYGSTALLYQICDSQ